MSFHVRSCNGEHHLRYPGLTAEEAQHIANMINEGVLSLYPELVARKEAAAKARIVGGPTNPSGPA